MGIEVLLITQARMGSTRLPGKILKKVNSKSLLQIHTERLLAATKVNRILIATTENNQDDQIYDWAISNGFLSYRGSEFDVLDRFYQAAKEYCPKWIVRVTSDCPLLDPILVDQIIEKALETKVDYCSNVIIEKFPDGQDVEVFTFAALETTWKLASLKSEREHVTSFIRNNINGKGKSLFTFHSIEPEKNYSKIRMTVDEEQDFVLVNALIEAKGQNATWMEYVNHILDNGLLSINENILRNEGYIKSIKND